jgi:hypothetical protein
MMSIQVVPLVGLELTAKGSTTRQSAAVPELTQGIPLYPVDHSHLRISVYQTHVAETLTATQALTRGQGRRGQSVFVTRDLQGMELLDAPVAVTQVSTTSARWTKPAMILHV